MAQKLKEMKLKTRHLQKMAVSWAKNSSQKIIPIAKELQDANILGAVTLAVQSLDEETLKIIKRGKDITIVSFSEALVQVMRVYKFLKSNNISPEVIDLRTLRPIDKQTIINSVILTVKKRFKDLNTTVVESFKA